jgi:hypothetical protein
VNTEPASFVVEKLDESSGHCDCCGHESRCVWGFVSQNDATIAAYWMHWTVDHLADHGAHLDLIIGRWGEDTSSDHRAAVSLEHRQQPDGSPALMVIDPADSAAAKSDLAATALSREEVIGTPLAKQVFDIVDAIYSQDDRFF